MASLSLWVFCDAYLKVVVVVRNMNHPPLAATAEHDLVGTRPALPSDRDGLALGSINLLQSLQTRV